MKPLINNQRAKKEWNYIVRIVGEEKAFRAMESLPGKRKPYPINIAQVLRIKFPPIECLEESEVDTRLLREKGKAELKRLRKQLKI